MQRHGLCVCTPRGWPSPSGQGGCRGFVHGVCCAASKGASTLAGFTLPQPYYEAR